MGEMDKLDWDFVVHGPKHYGQRHINSIDPATGAGSALAEVMTEAGATDKAGWSVKATARRHGGYWTEILYVVREGSLVQHSIRHRTETNPRRR